MKLMSDIAKTSLPVENKPCVVDLVAVVGGWKTLKEPTSAEEIHCTGCDSRSYYIVRADPAKKDMRIVRICANGDCATNKTVKPISTISPHVKVRKPLEWALFCEINTIGDKHHGVKFEKISQSPAKIAYMQKFATSPSGLIYMHGTPGSGKTYSCMGMCELFTRKDDSCLFVTQKQMLEQWLYSFNEKSSTYAAQLRTTTLLVIDDFGTGEVPPGFMAFFMDIINTRMQWTNRGTVISTNLNDDKFHEFCGDALFERIITGQEMVFDIPSRRKKQVL